MFQWMQNGEVGEDVLFALVGTLFIAFHITIPIVDVLELAK